MGFAGDLSPKEEAQAWADLDEWGSTQISETIKDLRGFYVKTGQVISTRVDLFPEAYTSKLASLQDSLEPMPFELVEAIVRQELLEGEPLGKLFSSFSREPLGAASIAQVHKATLLDGRVVAVKLQRPNVVPMLLGDIENLKSFSKKLRDALPVDYYTVFCELGRALEYELDFLHEAQAAEKIWAAVTHTIGGKPAKPSLAVPRAVPGLASRRVLVMDYIPGTPLSRLRQEMEERGLTSDSPESKLLGKKLLISLTEAYGRMIFGTGFIHGDPHPGNIFIMPGAEISLIDCGQVKQISSLFRRQLAEAVLAVGEYLQAAPEGVKEVTPERQALIPKIARAVGNFGVTFSPDLREKALQGHRAEVAAAAAAATDAEGEGAATTATTASAEAEAEAEAAVAAKEAAAVQRAEDECAAAVALLLFGTPAVDLPGGYSHVELSDKSPIKQVLAFPQELVMLGRATVLIKGIASRLNIPWSLAIKWQAACQAATAVQSSLQAPSSSGASKGQLQLQRVPVWAKAGGLAPGPIVPHTEPVAGAPSSSSSSSSGQSTGSAASVAALGGSRARFSQVRGSFRDTRRLLKAWAVGRGKAAGLVVLESLPTFVQAPIKKRAVAAATRALERQEKLAAAQELEG